MKLQLYVIHTLRLKKRQVNLHTFIQTIRTAAEQCGLSPNVHMILKPDTEALHGQVEELSKRVDLTPVGIPEFDRTIVPLSLEHISNFDKQRQAWKLISESNDDDTVYMVIEDDIFIMGSPEDQNRALAELFTCVRESHSAYDFLTLCLADQSPTTDMRLLNVKDLTVHVLPSKEAYFIKPNTARLLYSETEKMKFGARIHMSYVLLHTSHQLRVLYPSKRVFVEGSKLGVYTSTVQDSNVLIYNQEFMELWKYMSMETIPVKEIRDIYKKVQHLRNPDIMHMFVEAVEAMREAEGLLTGRSELLNNAINIHEHAQWDMPSITGNPSKYDTLYKK
jgi:hypothetical protein